MAKKKSKPRSPLLGRWEITSMSEGDEDYLNEEVQASSSASRACALRRGVIDRKTSGGTDREGASRFVEGMLSMVATSRQQRIDVLDDLTRCDQARLDGKIGPSLLPSTSTASAA